MMADAQADVLRLLRDRGIPFVVIGGHAVGFHGLIRATEDVDVVWLRSPDAQANLLAALQSIHAQWISDEVDPVTGIERLVPVTDEYIQANRLMMLVTDLGFLDLFDYVPGLPNADVADLHRQSIESGGIRYASLDWLKRMKRAAGRPKDQDDLDKLQ